MTRAVKWNWGKTLTTFGELQQKSFLLPRFCELFFFCSYKECPWGIYQMQHGIIGREKERKTCEKLEREKKKMCVV